MTLKNDIIRPLLKINSYVSSQNMNDLFDLTSQENINKEYNLSNEDKEIFIISYQDEKQNINSDIISKNDLFQKHLKKLIKITSYIIYKESSTSYLIINSFKYQQNNQNLFKPNICERIWLLFKKDEYNKINEGDIIKLGYLRLKFDKIVLENKLNENVNFSSNENNSNANKLQESEENKRYCRHCFQPETNINDPLICPCKCKNSLKYIHYSCLKNIINVKIHKKHDKYYDIYFLMSYNCDICLSTFPKYITYKNKNLNLLDIDVSNYKNYILCDMSKYDKENNYIFHIGYIVIKLDENVPLTIGRKKTNQITFNDVSISRNHCEIIKKDNNIFVKDLGSKFGTYKYIKDEHEINIGDSITLISGKFKFEFNLSKKETLFNLDLIFNNLYKSIFNWGCCCSNFTKDKGDVPILQNEEQINPQLNSKLCILNKDSKTEYDKRFKDFDSYNDYIINMDEISENSEKDKKSINGNFS